VTPPSVWAPARLRALLVEQDDAPRPLHQRLDAYRFGPAEACQSTVQVETANASTLSALVLVLLGAGASLWTTLWAQALMQRPRRVVLFDQERT
jgi:hypothetical protein